MKKQLFVLGAGVFLSAGAMALGTVTLSSTNTPASITQYTVECGQSRTSEINTQKPIPANKSVQLNDFIVKLLGTPLFCDFYETKGTTIGKDIGWAQLTISSGMDTATINQYQNLDPKDYTVTANNAPIASMVGVPETALSVNLAHN